MYRTFTDADAAMSRALLPYRSLLHTHRKGGVRTLTRRADGEALGEIAIVTDGGAYIYEATPPKEAGIIAIWATTALDYLLDLSVVFADETGEPL